MVSAPQLLHALQESVVSPVDVDETMASPVRVWILQRIVGATLTVVFVFDLDRMERVSLSHRRSSFCDGIDG